MRKIRVGSRDSQLAIVQSEFVIKSIKQYNPNIQIELITMKTTGDKILDRPLDKIGGKGLFVKELDEALFNNRVDITVHSYKDLPMEENYMIPIVALSKREDPRDVQIFPKQHQDKNLPVGSSSLRRKIQLEELIKEIEIKSLRGNIQTRIKKLENKEYSSIILAAAGINRLGLEGSIGRYFSIDEILPSASQGIIAVQGRKGEIFDFLQNFHSQESELISQSERSFIKTLEGGCSSPMAAYAMIVGQTILLKGLYYNEKTGKILKGCIEGRFDEAKEIGIRLAFNLKENNQ